MKLKIFIAFMLAFAVAFVVYSQTKRKNFALAEDFPRGALVYAQTGDLPALVKIFSESEFIDKYAKSGNFDDFRNRHLGRKLASRWQEFNDGAGVSFDLKTVARLTEGGAAIAVYDVGKLEFVFVAPMRNEVFAGIDFLRNRDKFAEETLAGGEIVRRAAIKADRGRQKQELIFANVKNRFVLATSEKLLARTLNNINDETSKNRLSDEPAFAVLSRKIEPHAATVWINQTALNDDYYFKRYWLMSAAENLKNVRAGIFDFEIGEGKAFEHRRFLLNEKVENATINFEHAYKLLAHLPPEIPLYRLQKSDARTIGETINKTVFEPRLSETTQKSRRSIYFSPFDASDETSEYHGYLSEKFDENINEVEADETIERQETTIDFSESLASARPQAILTFARSQILPAPLFIDFRRAAIFHLGAPKKFNRQAFETAIAGKFAAQTMIAAPNAEFVWETKTENETVRRELKLPMLEWRAVYELRGDLLILANDASFFQEIVASNNSTNENQTDLFADLTVINLSERKTAYDDVFDRLNEKNASDDFFSGNIKSLLDAADRIKKIEIRKNFRQNILEEELIFSYQ
jgi:hypothetical protein